MLPVSSKLQFLGRFLFRGVTICVREKSLLLPFRQALLNPIKSGVSFLPAANLGLYYFWTTCGMNLKLYDFSQLLLEIILLKKKNRKKILNFQLFLKLFAAHDFLETYVMRDDLDFPHTNCLIGLNYLSFSKCCIRTL